MPLQASIAARVSSLDTFDAGGMAAVIDTKTARPARMPPDGASKPPAAALRNAGSMIFALSLRLA